jgi:hypothetical protein
MSERYPSVFQSLHNRRAEDRPDNAPEGRLLELARLLANVLWAPVPRSQNFTKCRLRLAVRLARKLVEAADAQ